MTDRAYDPADANPFDQFDPDKVGALPANQNKKQNDPFEEFNPFPGQGIKPRPDETSATGAFARGVERSAVPALGSLPAIGAGAEAGAFLGTFGGPFAPLTVPAGAVIGGVVGGFTGGYALSKAQDYVLSKAPDSWKEKIGLDDRQEKLDEQEHPYASFLGGLTPYALTMRPGGVATAKLPENATALQRILAHPATARVFGGAAMGGMELGQEAAGGQSPDWTKVAVSTGFGLVFNTPTRIGERLTEVGAHPARALLGRPQPVPAATAPPASEQPTEAPQEAPAPTPARPAPPEGIAPTLFHAPTVAQANDLGVMGPGATEQTFFGAHERNPDAAMTAQEQARTEQSVTQTTPSLPDIHEVARRMDPDLFDQYEEINQRRNTLQEWVTSEGAENAPVAAGHLATLNGELAELEPKIAAAYRRAAEASGHPTVEPQPVSESWGLFPPPEVRAPPPIDATHTVVSGANSSRQAGGPVFVDPEIPEVSPTLKTSAGEPAPLRKYVAIHEDAERNEMLRFEAEFREMHGREPTKEEWNDHYNNFAHPKVATPAERAAVEADGVNWNDYTHEMDGFLSHIEHQPNTNPPPNTITDPEADIGHHRSENKPVAETGILGTAPRSIEAQKQFIAADVAKQLTAAGRPSEEAEAAGKLVAARYEARAARMGGRLGTAQELYEREGAQIRGPRGPAAPPPASPPTVAPTPAAEAAPLAERAPADQWNAFVAARQDREQTANIATGYNDQRTKTGAPIRRRATQAWTPGNVVDVGFVKDLLITKKNSDGTYTLIAKPDANGISKSYNAEPQKGLVGDKPVSFKEATAPLYETEPEIAVGPKTARGPRAMPQERWSLLQFLTDRGGIRPDDKNVGDVKQSFGGKNHFEPGFGQLIRPGGMTLDKAREAAVEAGYLQDRGGTEEGGGVATTNLDTLLQAIDKEARGAKVYRQGIEPADARVRDIDEAEAERYRAEQAETDKTVSDYLKDVGMKSTDIEPNIMARMRELISRQRLEPDIAHERAVMEADDHAVETENAPERAEYIPGWDVPDESRGTQEAGKTTKEGEAAPGVGPRTDRQGNREAAWQEFYQRKSLTEQREAEGQQQIPGAEKITDAELAQRRANEPLKPTAEQKPMDEGLFGDTDKQGELFQGAQGKIRLLEGRRPIITLMRDANASTFIHESGHQWLEELMRDASHEAAPDDLKADAVTVQKWLGIDKPENIKTAQHEKFARGFEQYVREGIAPSPELAGIFAKFKNWLMGIYRTIKGLGQPINDDIKRVFDRMLSTEPQKTVIAPERTVRPTLADIHRIDAQETPPNEAEPRGDLVNAEAERYIAEPHAEIAHEIQARTAEVQAEREAAAEGAAAEPAGEARPDEAGSTVLGASGGGAESQPGGGGVGEGRGAVEEGGGGPVREGNELPGGERGPEPGRESTKDAGGNPLASEPGTTFGLGGESFNVGKEGNVRVENITSVPQFAQAIAESAERIGGTGPATMGQMLDLANDLYIDPAKIDEKHLASMFGGIQNLNAKIWALRTAIRDGSKIVFDLSQRYQQSGNDADLAAFAQATARQDMMMSVISSVTTESGRATGMGFRNMEGWEQAQNLGEELKKRTGRELFQLKMMANLISTLDTPGKVAKALRDAQDRSWGGMILEYFVNALISGPSTHVTYTMGNLLLAGVKAGIDTPIAAAIGAARRAGGREGEVVHIGEVGAQFRGAVRGLPGAVQSMIEAARTGQTTLLPGELARPLMPFQGDTALAVAKSMTDDPVAWREVGAQMFGMMRGIRDGFVAGAALLKAGGIEGAPLIGAAYSPLGQIPDLAYRGVRILPGILPGGTMVRLPGRGVAAIHSFYRSLNYSIDKAADAYRTASEEGLTGNDFAARVGDIWQNPAPEKMELYRQGATERTLMGQGGVFVKAISNLVNTSVNLPLLGKTAPLKFIDPFVHIGGNIIKQAVMERTVLGALSSEIRADLSGANGNVAADMAAAKMITGTTMALLFGGLAMEGYASGSGPAEKDKAAMWRLAGNQAHSVRIGDIWYQVNRLGPLGMLMGSAADMYDVAHDASQGDLLTAGAHLLHAFSQNILDESFVRGPADLIRAVEDPGRYGEAYVRQFLSSFVPFSVGMAQMARASDPYSRQARTVMDALKAKIPGLSETLFPRRDIWGEEMPSYEALGHAGLTSIYETRVSRDPVNQAMLNLGISPAQPIRKIRNVDLTDQQYDDYSRIAGRMTKMRLDAIVKSPDWQTWPNHIKHDVISEVLRQSREAASGIMMAKYPQIVSDATAAKMKKLQD